MEGKDAITMDRFVFMIGEKVEILAKQCSSHAVIWNPRTPPPSGMNGTFDFSPPQAKVNVELLRPHMTHTHTFYRQQ